MTHPREWLAEVLPDLLALLVDEPPAVRPVSLLALSSVEEGRLVKLGLRIGRRIRHDRED